MSDEDFSLKEFVVKEIGDIKTSMKWLGRRFMGLEITFYGATLSALFLMWILDLSPKDFLSLIAFEISNLLS